MRQYTDEIKAQVITEWMAGASLPQLAGAHGIPASTIEGWVKGRQRLQVVKKKSLEDYDFDSGAAELIDGSVRAYTSILRAAEDEAWIKRHSPSEVAILAGVIADKLYRILGAIDRKPQLPTGDDAQPG